MGGIIVCETLAASERRNCARAQLPLDKSAKTTAAQRRSRYIPAEVRRAVRERVGDRFTFVGEEGPRWWIPGWEKTGPSYARWFRYRIPQRLADGTLDPLSLPPIVDTMTAALNATIGPPTAPFVAPSLSLTIQFHRMTWTPWLLVHARVLSMDHGYASVAGEVWSESGDLIATATQTMVPLST